MMESGNRFPWTDLIGSARGASVHVIACMDEQCRSISRCLYRHDRRHVLVTGERGVGKTTLLQEFARRIAAGSYPHLSRHAVKSLDCSGTSIGDCQLAVREALGSADGLAQVFVFDRIVNLLGKSGCSEPWPILRSLLMVSGASVIGTLSPWEYQELTGRYPEMFDYFGRVDVAEPEDVDLRVILAVACRSLESESSLSIQQDAIERAIVLTGNYIPSEKLPGKAIKVLRDACAAADYSRTQEGRDCSSIGDREIVQATSERTGLPFETLAGELSQVNFEAALGESVLGQPEAVRAVANELRLIKAGLTEPDKPASVMLFAGLTGVGKTELAKRVAELYATSRRLQSYAMGNYTEAQSVSGINGVPAGYVGHDEGGRLVNQLNSDPYSVVLLDEAEKAHPNVWKPFLNLFDEGWIVDQRGVKAYADRAIFILTTNAGDRTIAQLSRDGATETEIVEAVKESLARVKHERAGEVVFPPQFLARLKRIVVFRPLDQAAMLGIAQKLFERMRLRWKNHQGRDLIADEAIIRHIAKAAHEHNERAGGKEGGRIVRKLLSELVEIPVQDAGLRWPDAYLESRGIRLTHREVAGASGMFVPDVSFG